MSDSEIIGIFDKEWAGIAYEPAITWHDMYDSRTLYKQDLIVLCNKVSKQVVEAYKAQIRKKIESILKDHAFWYSEGDAVYCRCEFRWGTYLKWVEHRDQKLLEILGEEKP